MKKTIFLLSIMLCLLSLKSLKFKQLPKGKIFEIKTSSFKQSQNLALYNSLILGNKIKLKKEHKSLFKDLGLMHLMTPSGLHFQVLIFLVSLFMGKIKYLKKYKEILEIYIGVLTYVFVPSLMAFKRYALLYAARKFNQYFLKNYFSSINLVSLVFLYDFQFGTMSFQPMSYLLSLLFIGILNFKKFLNLQVYYHLYLGQVLTNYIFQGIINPLNLILSPILTIMFSFIYPLLLINLPIIETWNFSEHIIKLYVEILEHCHFITSFIPNITLTTIVTVLLIILNSKNFLFVVPLIVLDFITN